MTEQEFERLEKARGLKEKIKTCDGLIRDIIDGALIPNMDLSTAGRSAVYGVGATNSLNNIEGFYDEMRGFVLEFIQRKRDFFQRQFDEL